MEVLGVLLGIIMVMGLTYKKIPIGFSMLLASLLVAVFSRMGFENGFQTLVTALMDSMTIKLVLVVFLIGIIGKMLKETGSLEIMLNKLAILVKDVRVQIVMLPSLIGLLTVPGGAVLSAPMVEEAGKGHDLSKVKMAAANLLYRHLWYFIFPLYPALIMATELAGIDVIYFILFNLPVVIIVFFVSFFILFKDMENIYTDPEIINNSSQNSYQSELFQFIKSIFPILVAVILALAGGLYLPLALFIGLLLAFVNYLGGETSGSNLFAKIRTRLKYARQGIDLNMVLAIIGIMVFKDFVEGSGALDVIAVQLMELGIPLGVLVPVSSFITGFLTANHIASIGIVFPLLSPLFPEAAFAPLMGLLYAGGVTGYIISPLHLCLILTREYFKVPFKEMYTNTAPLVLLILLGIGISAAVWQLF